MGVLSLPWCRHISFPIKNRSKNRHQNLWDRWCVSSWRPRFWSRYYIYIVIFYVYKSTLPVSYNLSYYFLFHVVNFCSGSTGSVTLSPQDVSVPRLALRLPNWWWFYWTSLCHIYILNWDILQGSFRLCNWLSLRRLVSWINHLPPVCWSTFWNYSL